MEHVGPPGPGAGAGRVGEEGGTWPGSGLARVTAHVLARLGQHSGAEFSHFFMSPGNGADSGNGGAVYTNSGTVNYTGGIYQYQANDTLIQFNGKEVTGTYCLSSDPMMTNPLPVSPAGHTKRLKAIIQQYMQRMLDDKLTVEDNTI